MHILKRKITGSKFLIIFLFNSRLSSNELICKLVGHQVSPGNFIELHDTALYYVLRISLEV